MSEAIVRSPAEAQPEWVRLVREKVESLNYGVVQLVVHDGRVTQIERTEKTRLKPDVRKSDSD
jgi:hypothetical protein